MPDAPSPSNALPGEPLPGGNPPEVAARRPDRRSLLRNGAALSAAALIGTPILSACSTQAGKNGSKNGRSGKAGETLFIAGFQWGPPTNFNPLNSSPAWPIGWDQGAFVYEKLLRFNQLNGKMEPSLATGMKTPDDTTIELPLQPTAKWQDGTPLTAKDVVYTFELAKRHSELAYSWFWQYVDSVTARGDHRVVFKLKKDQLNPGMVHHAFHYTSILPEHIWSGIEKKNKEITQATNMSPVGSGPYKVTKYDQQQIELTRHSGYWGSALYGAQPAPKYVNHPIFKDNDAGSLAFQKGEVDVSQQFTPQLQKLWQDKKVSFAVSTWSKKKPYHLPGTTPMLVFNLTKKGLSDSKVRHALAHAINYPQIAASAMAGYSETVQSSLILPSGSEKQYFDQGNVDAHGWKYDLKEAVRILEQDLKAKKGSDGIYKLPDGTRLGPYTLQTPTGWSDYQSACRIIADNAKAIGIDVKTQFPQAPNVTANVQNGDFDLAVWGVSPISPATPWQRMRDVLDSRGVPAPGKAAFWNYGRYKNPAVEKLLDQAAAETDPAKLKPVLTQIDTIFMKDAPMVPVVYRPSQFFEWNESNWKNFPSEANPYAAPTFNGDGTLWLFKIKKIAK